MTSPSILILVRAGRDSLHRSWSHLCHQIADVAVSTYDDTDWSGPDVNYLHHVPGENSAVSSSSSKNIPI